jgi:predicted nucleic acid-binding protein
MTVLVDTSVLSLALRRRRPDQRTPVQQAIVDRLIRLLDNDQAAIIGMVRQELLSGVRHAEQFARLQTVLDGFVPVAVSTPDHDLAAGFFNRCRSRGVAATDVDMLICAAAERRGLPVFTTDPDFGRYADVVGIKLEPIPG